MLHRTHTTLALLLTSRSDRALTGRSTGPARAVRCASAAVEAARGLGAPARAGLHTGECDLVPGGLAGEALDIAGRVAAAARSGDVLVSATVKDLIAGAGVAFVPRGSLASGRGGDRRPRFAVAASPLSAVAGAARLTPRTRGSSLTAPVR